MRKRKTLLPLAAIALAPLLAQPMTNAVGAAGPAPFSGPEIASIQRITADAVTSPVVFRAVRMTVGDALAAIAPGEMPMGDQTAQIADHTAAVMVGAGTGLAAPPKAVPPGTPGNTKPQPVAILLLVDLTDGMQLGGTYVFQANDVARVDLTTIAARRRSSPEVPIVVNPRQ